MGFCAMVVTIGNGSVKDRLNFNSFVYLLHLFLNKDNLTGLSKRSNLLCVHYKFMQANWYLCAT
jgi:hypothetical protein